MKFISPGGWFSIEYPKNWHEFEDSEESFLFYNPDSWTGNFRISAFRGEKNYGQQCVAYELEENKTAVSVKVGNWNCAYSAETFQENGEWYTMFLWITGKDDIAFECSFTVAKGGERTPAEDIIRTLEVRKNTAHKEAEIIPIRVMEIGEVNMAYEWASTTVKKMLTKDFTAQEADIEKMQQLVDEGKIQQNQRVAWESLGLAFGAILVNEMDGMDWVTVVEGAKEYPALQFKQTELLINPAAMIWNEVKAKKTVKLRAMFEAIKTKVEDLLNQ